MFKLSNNWSGLSQLINEYNWRHVVATSHNISMQMTQVQFHLSLRFKISRISKYSIADVGNYEYHLMETVYLQNNIGSGFSKKNSETKRKESSVEINLLLMIK